MNLSLGTAQLGLHYGIANNRGMLSDKEAEAVLDAAWDCGIRHIDTSPVYGVAEQRIDEYLRWHVQRSFWVTTKISPGKDSEFEAPDVVLYHCIGCDVENLDPQGVDGISLYTADEVYRTRLAYGIYQLPASALDGRNDDVINVHLSLARKTVQIRSLLLQGLMSCDLDDCSVPGANLYLLMLRHAASDYSMGIIELCVRWAWEFSAKEAIIGAETVEQVEQIAQYFARGPLPIALSARVRDLREGIPEAIISPRMWRQNFDFT